MASPNVTTNALETLVESNATAAKYAPDPNVIIVNTVFGLVLSIPVVLLGLVANSINLIVFYRQGPLTDSCTICLMALTVADLFVCLMGLFFWTTRFVNELFFYHLSFEQRYLVVDLLGYGCNRSSMLVSLIACWVTAYISIERCLSVVLPFKVKEMFTPLRSLAILVFVGVVLCVISAPFILYTVMSLTPHWFRNNTVVLWTVPTHFFSTDLYYLSATSTAFYCRLIFIIILIVCNLIIFRKVVLSQKFRSGKKSDGGKADSTTEKTEQQSKTSAKETRLLRMIMTICLIFLCCNTPVILHVVLAIYIYPLFGTKWSNQDDSVAENLGAFTEAVNSSVNIFIYYNMNTRYREELQLLAGNIKKMFTKSR